MRAMRLLSVLLLACPAAAKLPLAPHGRQEHSVWRSLARREIESAIAASPLIPKATATLRRLARIVPQLEQMALPHRPAPLGLQPRWRSTQDPAFIPATVQDIEEHLESAERLDLGWGWHEREEHLPSALRSAIAFVAEQGCSIVGWRAEHLAELCEVARALLPLTDLLYEQYAPPHIENWSGRPKMHVAFIAACSRALDLPDLHLAHDLLCGMPVWGDLPRSGCWPATEEAPAPTAFSREDNLAWVDDQYKRLQDAPVTDHTWECWHATLEEVNPPDPSATPTMAGPFTREEMDDRFGAGLWRPMTRFPVCQKGSIRPCDDGSASGHNAVTRAHERLRCVGADWPARAARAFVVHLGDYIDWEMLLATDDQYKAYRLVPTCSPELTVVAMTNPATGEPTYFTLPGFNFGLLSAVHGFNRVPETTTAIAQRLGACVCCHYYDDFPTCEPSFAADSGQLFLQEVQRLAGFPMSIKKMVKPKRCGVFLGLTTDFARLRQEGIVEMYLDQERAEAYNTEIMRVRMFEALYRCTAEKLCGKLEWALCTRLGRAMLAPIRHRANDRRGLSTITTAIDLSLRYFFDLLPRLPRRKIRLRGRLFPCIKVWTDAMWEPESEAPARIGIVVYVPARMTRRGLEPAHYRHASLVVPENIMAKFVRRKQYIGQLELLAAVAAYTTFPELLRGRRVIHWIDNTSALAALIKGYSSTPDSAGIVHAFHSFNSALQSDIWFEYVASKANIADLPSRGDFTLLRRLGSREYPCILPSLDEWSWTAKEWMMKAMPASGPKRHRTQHGDQRPRRRKNSHQGHHTPPVPPQVPRRSSQPAELPRSEEWDHLVKDVRFGDYDVYVGRASGGAPRCEETEPRYGIAGRWGNEFPMLGATPEERARVCRAHRETLLADPARIARVRSHLCGKRLACWCRGHRCHAQDLAEVANCTPAHLEAITGSSHGWHTTGRAGGE